MQSTNENESIYTPSEQISSPPIREATKETKENKETPEVSADSAAKAKAIAQNLATKKFIEAIVKGTFKHIFLTIKNYIEYDSLIYLFIRTSPRSQKSNSTPESTRRQSCKLH